MEAAFNHRSRAKSAHAVPTSSDLVVRHIEQTCSAVIDGRVAARALAEWTRRFALSEPEFQILWCLRDVDSGGLDQTTLAGRLANSPAQISATVERLRMRGWLCKGSCAGDRRRQFWRLTTSGQQLLDEMLKAAALLRYESTGISEINGGDGSAKEVAA